MSEAFDLELVRMGNTSEFRRFFDSLYPKMMGLACRFVDESIAEDLVQEVFASYWEQKQNLKIIHIQSYLYKCVQNLCLNHIKHEMVANEYSVRIKIAEERIRFLESQTDENETIQTLIKKDFREIIDSSVEKLPPKCGEAFRMCYFQDMSYKEIAEKMHISPRTVEVHVQKAIHFLKKDLSTLILLIFILKPLN